MSRPLTLLVAAFVAVVPAAATAQSLADQAPPKLDPSLRSPDSHPVQGGDTFRDAYLVTSTPFAHSGTTAGYTDDYDEVCPYSGSTSPDVVYAINLDYDTIVDIDMCGSAYDTKIYLYGEGLQLIACNDDYYDGEPCGQYVSRLNFVELWAGQKYFLVIDGYGGDFGPYELLIHEIPPCDLACPPEAWPEGEPPLAEDYVDLHNPGCNHPGYDPIFQLVYSQDWTYQEVFCGVSGWFLADGVSTRDSDWLNVQMGHPGGPITVTVDAELPVHLAELYPQDCAAVAIQQMVTAGPCDPQVLTVDGYPPGAMVWIWVAPTTFTGPNGPGEFDYVLWLDGIMGPAATVTERTTWGACKALYR